MRAKPDRTQRQGESYLAKKIGSGLERGCHSRQCQEPDYFSIANRADADSYFSMNRLVSATCLAIATLLVLIGCATDDDPFPVHPAATTTDSEMPVPGAASPAGESSSAGWKW